MVKRKSLSTLLLDSVTPKLYSLIQIGFKNEKDLYNTTRLVEQFSRKILNHDIPSLKMTASRHGLVALSSPLIGLKYSILVYHKQMIENQWEDYKSSISDYDVMINPIITRYTEEKETKEEECTVLPLIYFTVERPTAIEVEFKDINEINRCEMFYGFEARVLHHEIDHLQGTVPSNLKVCKGKIRQKYNLEHSDKVDNYYDALCKDEMAKLENLYSQDPKFNKKVKSQGDKRDYFMRIILGDEKFNEYMTRKTEALRIDITKGKLAPNN